HYSFPLLFFNDTSTTEIYTLSLHDALPICPFHLCQTRLVGFAVTVKTRPGDNLMIHKAISLSGQHDVIVVDGGGDISNALVGERSEEHTSELQSRENLVCRLLLEKKKKSTI